MMTNFKKVHLQQVNSNINKNKVKRFTVKKINSTKSSINSKRKKNIYKKTKKQYGGSFFKDLGNIATKTQKSFTKVSNTLKNRLVNAQKSDLGQSLLKGVQSANMVYKGASDELKKRVDNIPKLDLGQSFVNRAKGTEMAFTSNFNKVTSNLGEMAKATRNSQLSQNLMDAVRNPKQTGLFFKNHFLKNLNHDRNDMEELYNNHFKSLVPSSSLTIKNPLSFNYNGLRDAMSTKKMAMLGLGAAVIGLGYMYYVSKGSDDQVKILKKQQNFVSKKKDDFVRLQDLQMSNVNVEYFDEELVSKIDNDPYYSFRQIFPEKKKQLLRDIYEVLKDLGKKDNIIEKVDKIKKLKKVIISIKKRPYLLKERTNLCFSNSTSELGGVPLLFCIFESTDDLRVIKLVIDIYNKGTLKIHEFENLTDQLRSLRYNFTVLDYLLSQKVRKDITFSKINWLISYIGYTGITYHTLFLYLKYIRNMYREIVFDIKKGKTKTGFTILNFKTRESEPVSDYDFLYIKCHYLRHLLINGLHTLLKKYSQNNNKLTYVNLFEAFVEILTSEKNLIPLDIQIIECLILNNFTIDINDSNKDKYQKLLYLESTLDQQRNQVVINNYSETNDIKKEGGLPYGQLSFRKTNEQLLNLNDNHQPLKMKDNETNGLYCSLKSNIFHNIKRYQKNSEGKSVSPYLLFPINKEEMKYSFVNTIHCNHSYSRLLINKKLTKIKNDTNSIEVRDNMLKENVTCTKVFLTLESAIQDLHYHQVYFLNRPFKMKLVNNFVVFVKKTKKSFVKVSVHIHFKGEPLSNKEYHFWVQRNEIDFYIDSKYEDKEINIDSHQITKERSILIKNIQESSYPGLLSIFNRFLQTKGTYAYSYKDINIVFSNLISLEYLNNSDNLILLFFKRLRGMTNLQTLINELINDQLIEPTFIKQLNDTSVKNFSTDPSVIYCYLDNGNYIFFKEIDFKKNFPNIIKIFLSSKEKKNLIIPFNNSNKVRVIDLLDCIQESINQYYSLNYERISECLSKSIIIVDKNSALYSGQERKLYGQLITDENREVYPDDSVYIEETSNKLLVKKKYISTDLKDSYYSISNLIPKIKKILDPIFIEVSYNSSNKTLTLKNNSDTPYTIGHLTILQYLLEKGTCYKFTNGKYDYDINTSLVNKNETLYLFLGENFISKPEKSPPKYLALSTTIINHK